MRDQVSMVGDPRQLCCAWQENASQLSLMLSRPPGKRLCKACPWIFSLLLQNMLLPTMLKSLQ
ncbi:hypothetical protein C0J52_18294 [Blattella germanica]|nr:hypothetical protein C0J52_18294 [Blattella germanica]